MRSLIGQQQNRKQEVRRGGKPETIAVQQGEKWVINGRKTFTTMAPVLDYFIISASMEGREEVGEFVIPRNTLGVSIEETWDSARCEGLLVMTLSYKM